MKRRKLIVLALICFFLVTFSSPAMANYKLGFNPPDSNYYAYPPNNNTTSTGSFVPTLSFASANTYTPNISYNGANTYTPQISFNSANSYTPNVSVNGGTSYVPTLSFGSTNNTYNPNISVGGAGAYVPQISFNSTSTYGTGTMSINNAAGNYAPTISFNTPNGSLVPDPPKGFVNFSSIIPQIKTTTPKATVNTSSKGTGQTLGIIESFSNTSALPKKDKGYQIQDPEMANRVRENVNNMYPQNGFQPPDPGIFNIPTVNVNSLRNNASNSNDCTTGG